MHQAQRTPDSAEDARNGIAEILRLLGADSAGDTR